MLPMWVGRCRCHVPLRLRREESGMVTLTAASQVATTALILANPVWSSGGSGRNSAQSDRAAEVTVTFARVLAAMRFSCRTGRHASSSCWRGVPLLQRQCGTLASSSGFVAS